jgi:hypothetical protein
MTTTHTHAHAHAHRLSLTHANTRQRARPQAKRQKLRDSAADAYIGAAPLEGAEGAGGGGSVITQEGGKDVRPPPAALGGGRDVGSACSKAMRLRARGPQRVIAARPAVGGFPLAGPGNPAGLWKAARREAAERWPLPPHAPNQRPAPSAPAPTCPTQEAPVLPVVPFDALIAK